MTVWSIGLIDSGLIQRNTKTLMGIVGDNSDAFPENRDESQDSDADGVGNFADLDDDNDGVNDEEDAFPLDPSRSEEGSAQPVPNLVEIPQSLVEFAVGQVIVEEGYQE